MNVKIKIVGAVLMSLLASNVFAQRSEPSDKFKRFKEKSHQKFESFREKANKQFLDMMSGEWDEGNAVEAPTPQLDDNVEPQTAPEQTGPAEDRYYQCEVIDYPDVVYTQPQPLSEVVCNMAIAQPQVSFMLYGTPCEIRFSDEQKFQLANLGNAELRRVWETFLTPEYENTLFDCLKLRDELNLCDWAYKSMLDNFVDEVLGKTDEAQLLLAYLYSQSGYDMRLVVLKDKLQMLYSADCRLQKTSITYANKMYYCDVPFSGQVSICQAGFPKEQPLSLEMSHQPNFVQIPSAPKMHATTNISTMMTLDVNLLYFYNSYPIAVDKQGDQMWQWKNYAMAPMSQYVKDQLYPVLQSHIEGKTEEEAVNCLLDYIQIGFAYKGDNEVWGQERTFFPEETLFYPFCDCEDRAILMSRLVRDLLNLDVALVYYPGHLATAVKFNEDIKGDYLTLNGEKFLICDPTFYGGKVGCTMTGQDNTRAKAVLLSKES